MLAGSFPVPRGGEEKKKIAERLLRPFVLKQNLHIYSALSEEAVQGALD